MAQARLVVFVAATAILAACGGAATPTSPAPAGGTQTIALQSGVWRGAFEITSCTGSSSLCHVGPEDFVLRLGAGADGVLLIDAKVWSGAPPAAVDVTRVKLDGGVTMLSRAPAGLAMPISAAELQLAEISETLAGTIRYTVTRSSGSAAKEGRILFAVREQTVYPARFQGEWTGHVTRTTLCSGECSSAWDPVLGAGDVRLLIAQSGGTVSGNFRSNDVSGTASGNAMTASRRYAIPSTSCRQGWDDGTICLIDMTFSVTVDSLDRLSGSITYRVEGVDYRGRAFAFSGTNDLRGLARWR